MKVCSHCGTAGHFKNENLCGTNPRKCANCGGQHPSNYRGCIEFKREREAQKIRSKEKKTLHDARSLARAKVFPPLPNDPSTSSAPETRNDLNFARAVGTQGNHNTQSEPTRIPQANLQSSDTTAGTSQHTLQGITQTAIPETTYNPSTTELKKLEESVEKMIKKVILKLFSEVTNMILNLANPNGEGSGPKTLVEFMGERLRGAINHALQDEDSDEQDPLDSDEEDTEDDTPEATGATSQQPSTNSSSRKKSNYVKRQRKTKKRRKKKQ